MCSRTCIKNLPTAHGGYHHDPTIADVFSDYGRKVGANAQASQCRSRHQMLEHTEDVNRTELNKTFGAQQRDNANADRKYLAENCTPYGR